MHPMWKVYKTKVLKTLNPDLEEDAPQEDHDVENDVSPVQEDEGPNAVTQLAKKVQGAGARGWNRMSTLFNKDDEHQLLEETESPPVADHPLAVKPEEPRPTRRSGFWDSFATKWHQKPAEAEAGTEGVEGGEEVGGGGGQDGERAESEGGGGGSGNNSFSKYAILGGGGGEETSFKWNFVTNKLAELKTKSMTKTN